MDGIPSLFRVTLKLSAALAICCSGAWPILGAQAQRDTVAPTKAQLIDDLVTANHILANEEIVTGLGHVSVRHGQNPDRFLLSRSLAPALVRAEDVMEFNLDGEAVDPRGQAVYDERFIHAAIYRARQDVNAVVHCHTPSLIPFANSNVALRPLSGSGAFFARGVPVFEPGSRGTGSLLQSMGIIDAERGQALARTLADKTVVLMPFHGAAIVGPSIPETVTRSIYLDVNAKLQAQAIALGETLRYLGPEYAPPPTSAPPVGVVNYGRDWQHWKQRATSK